MVKRGGTKRKAKMEKITNRGSLATTFTKRTNGLFSKVSQLCLLTDAQIAVLVTPASSNSSVNFYSFGHSSVDFVVNAYLNGERPVREETTREDDEDIGICMARKELGLDLWWEDDRLLQSANTDELIDKISRMLMKIKDLLSQDHQAFVNDDDVCLKNNNETMKQAESADETLILTSDSQICCIPDDNDMSEEQDQTLILQSDSNFNNMSEEQDKTLNIQSNSQICCNPILLDYNDSPADSNNVMTEEQEQIMAICDSFCAPENNYNNNVLTEEQDQIMAVCDSFSVPEIDIYQLIDFNIDMTLDASAFDAAFLDTTTTHEHELDKTTNSETTVACDDAFLDTTTSHDDHELDKTTNSATVACDNDASSVRDLDEDNLMFSDHLTQLLQS